MAKLFIHLIKRARGQVDTACTNILLSIYSRYGYDKDKRLSVRTMRLRMDAAQQRREAARLSKMQESVLGQAAPNEEVMPLKVIKCRLYPTRSQAETLNGQLAEACRLYNAGLQERRDAWHINGRSVNYFEQQNQLPAIRANGDIGLPNAGCAQDVLRRLDKAFKAFFTRIKRGEKKAGFPRFRSRSRYDSLTFKSYGDGARIVVGKLRVQGVGLIKLKLHLPIDEKKIKNVTIKREAGRWFVCFNVEYDAEPLQPCTQAVGVDVGLKAFATLSDGREIENPRHYRAAERQLRIAQRKIARRKKGSHRRRKAVQLLQRAHALVRNQRADFHHKVSRTLVNENGLIAVEDLRVKNMVRGWFGKSINDAGWTAFINKIAYKAECAGRLFVKVKPHGTSQKCSGCGHTQSKTLAERWHECERCGLSLSRDHNAAINILAAGIAVQELT